METLTIHPKDKDQLTTVKAVLKALKVPFEKAEEESPYNPEFVAKIKQGDRDIKAGKGRKVSLDELNRLWK